ncbi:MAG TPA: argininosuccinate synthase [Spirochaetota bacterium]|nr:argininosuccinate synthase [Spirochaetota bacterium]HOL56035.1 argininosuccinate synthase [Spirochaetota bacterium]HPP03477.1 argininosuccinate synthase [Spirochaetota bacterium]
MENIKKIALAYSGGLDTSIIIPWLKENFNNPEIVAVCVDVGQGEETENLEERAIKSGAKKFYLVDKKKEFVEDYIFPMAMCGALYENKYMLGTSIARPLQAKAQVEIALKEKCDALAHGCTGKGNDQVRFELTYKALAPHLKVIAPWRLWDIKSREDAIAYAKKKNIDLGQINEKKIYSRDRNIWHISHEGGELEDLSNRPNEEMFVLSRSPKDAPDKETEITIDFEKGIPVALNNKKMDGVSLLLELNRIGGENGIGRADIVENRLVGMKSHGVYETPGGTILYAALQELRMLTLEKDSLKMINNISPLYAEMIYNGKYFTHLRKSLEIFIRELMKYCTGSIKLVLYKGNIIVAGRKSEYSLYDADIASFTTGENYSHKDSQGFINLFGLQVGIEAKVHSKK